MWRVWCVSAVLVGVFWAIPAQSQVILGAEAEVGVPLGEWTLTPAVGEGVRVRAGYEIPTLGILYVQPELAFAVTAFQADQDRKDRDSVDMFGFQGGAGVRVTAGLRYEPSVFAHVGYGLLEGEGSDFTIRDEGVWFDVGLALDHRIDRSWTVGGHGALHGIVHTDNPNPSLPGENLWLALGLHVGMAL